MSDFSFSEAPFSVRQDIGDAHRRAWRRLAEPGTWWTGAERVAIAAEVRAAWECGLCAERKEAVPPYVVTGQHDRASDGLPDSAVEAVHRVTTDAARLKRAWLDELLAAGLSEGQYVEIVGLVSSVVSIDAFCRGIGVSLHPLPTPLEGEPSHYRPKGLDDAMAWVPVLHERDATGREANLYGMKRTGNVLKAMSLVPDAVRALMDLSAAHYLTARKMMGVETGRAIDRAQMELVAGRVSALNECFY